MRGSRGVGERGQGGEPRHEEKDPEGGGQMESKGWKQWQKHRHGREKAGLTGSR